MDQYLLEEATPAFAPKQVDENRKFPRLAPVDSAFTPTFSIACPLTTPRRLWFCATRGKEHLNRRPPHLWH
jgi:hypothetical protein